MAKVFKFKEDQDNFCCPQCALIEDYTELLLEAENRDELELFLSYAIDDAVKLGIKRALYADIENKTKILDEMDMECCCDDCDCDEDC